MRQHLWVLHSSHLLGTEQGGGGEVGVLTSGRWGCSGQGIPCYRLLGLKVSQRGSSPGGTRVSPALDLCSAPKVPLYFVGTRAPCGRQVPFF